MPGEADGLPSLSLPGLLKPCAAVPQRGGGLRKDMELVPRGNALLCRWAFSFCWRRVERMQTHGAAACAQQWECWAVQAWPLVLQAQAFTCSCPLTSPGGR